jgi:ketosteroid isomerase-like protein
MTETITVGMATAVVRQAYEAFLRRDVPTILSLVADTVDWEFVGSSGLPYAGPRHDRQGVADFFAAVAQTDDIQVFEPREFIESGEHVTVLGWERAKALDTGVAFESQWVHLFTVRNGRITRWRGLFNTAARYGK